MCINVHVLHVLSQAQHSRVMADMISDLTRMFKAPPYKAHAHIRLHTHTHTHTYARMRAQM